MFTDFKDFLLQRKKEDIQEASDSSEEVRELLLFRIKAKSSLGWIVWKEKEASLIRLFERVFLAVKLNLVFTMEYNVFMIEFLAPSTQLTRISKYVKGGQLQMEIDKIHGVFKDVLLSLIAPTAPCENFKGKSSNDVIQERVNNLIDIDYTRKREINALTAQFEALRDRVEGALSDFEEGYQKKLKETCFDTFDLIEKRLLEIMDQDLQVLRRDINEP